MSETMLAAVMPHDEAFDEPPEEDTPIVAGWGPDEYGRFMLSEPQTECAWISCEADSVRTPKR